MVAQRRLSRGLEEWEAEVGEYGGEGVAAWGGRDRRPLRGRGPLGEGAQGALGLGLLKGRGCLVLTKGDIEDVGWQDEKKWMNKGLAIR